MAILDKVKVTLRVTTTTFDDEITDLINAAVNDLCVAGIVQDNIVTYEDDATLPTVDDPLVIRAIATYCKCNFGSPDDYDRWKKSYDEQKAQMATNRNYTDYSDYIEEDS